MKGKETMKRLILVAMLFAPLAAVGQNESSGLTPAQPSWTPHPVLFSGPSLMSGGYQPVAEHVGAGFLLNSSNIGGDFESRYMNARKTNDNTVNNRKGHERYLQGRLFYKWHRGLYFGGGAQWSETSTTNYKKEAWRPTFGMGGDYFGDRVSLRWQALYILPGTDKSNGLQGPELQIWFPSPVSRSHFFYRETIGLYEFHQTVTDPSDPHLTAQQLSSRSVTSFLDFTFGWRF